jgi:hypothetical protein
MMMQTIQVLVVAKLPDLAISARDRTRLSGIVVIRGAGR